MKYILCLGFLLIATLVFSQKKFYLINGTQFEETKYQNFKDSISSEYTISEEIVFSYIDNGNEIFLPRLKVHNAKKNSTRIYFDENVFFEKTFKNKVDFTALKEIKSNKKIDHSKPYFINCWYVNCSPCIEEIPDLNKLHSEYIGKVNFVALTFDDGNKVKNFLNRVAFNFIHLTDQKNLLDKMEIMSYPVSLILDKDGNFIKFVNYQNQESQKYTKEILNRVINH
ncbi:TlpA family protein disulfide reductase [Chryseobacterium wangxinyae]|uniref:TlpA family protein disulfide reductase n=1 Tax=Chryseobacterium sp. CY353 TaxID=2997334 RepID=UPI002271D3B9|nr:TlpA disulfide reductase family protein [Chryseobacterium sp. CY353]MCY0969359.1 TlpA disulfide reductase family protein [Chryseobacterium sp. CY353]